MVFSFFKRRVSHTHAYAVEVSDGIATAIDTTHNGVRGNACIYAKLASSTGLQRSLLASFIFPVTAAKSCFSGSKLGSSLVVIVRC